MKKLIKKSFILLFTLSVMGALFISCEEDLYIREITDSTPIIASFSPSSGYSGSLITVKGEFLKNVDSAAFGNGEAVIYRVINDNEIVLKVTNSSVSGNIMLKNGLGLVESSESFTMEYVIPVASEWPKEQVINEDVSILGVNMQSVTNVYFTSLGSTELSEAVIVFQKEDELAVQVPYVDADWANEESVRATITVEYKTESGFETIEGAAYTFTAIKPEFEVEVWPTSALSGSEVNILGINVGLADSVYFGDVSATIVNATPYSITVDVPGFTERSFVNMRIVYFKNLEVINDIQTEVYTQYRKFFGNFEGGLSSMVERPDRVSPETEVQLIHSTDTPLFAPEGRFFCSYYSTPDPINKSSVPLYFNYDEGDGNTINLNAFTDPVLHFYYYNDSTPSYLQLEVPMGGSNMRLYIERYRTNAQKKWELVCVRLAEAGFSTGYDGPFGPIPFKDAYEAFHINYKPSDKYDTQFHIDNVFISEGAISGAIDLTKHTKEHGHIISIVE